MNDAKCVVNVKEFQQALDKALKAALKKSRIPVLMEALVSFDGDTCTLTCTDMELWVQAVIPALGEPCSFVLNDSRKLLTACKYFSGDLEFFYTKDQPPESYPTKTALDGTLTLRCGNKELRQRVTTTEDFPVMPKMEAEHIYRVDPASLSKRFERIKYALSSNESRPVNCCVKFFDNRIGAVDGYRLALNRDESLRVEAPFHIPPSAMKLLPIFDEAACQLSVGGNHALFDSGSVRVLTRMPEGDSLNFDAAIPSTHKEEHTVDIADFMDNLRYLSEFINYPSRESVRFEGGVLTVRTAKGEYHSKLELAEAPQTVFGFNSGYMLDGLKQFRAKNLDTVAMQLSAPTSPIILTDETDLAMVLPMRLRDAA